MGTKTRSPKVVTADLWAVLVDPRRQTLLSSSDFEGLSSKADDLRWWWLRTGEDALS